MGEHDGNAKVHMVDNAHYSFINIILFVFSNKVCLANSLHLDTV